MAVETFQEFVDSRNLRLSVDAESGVIQGVKLLGLESGNGRTYLKEAVARAVSLYEGAKVNIDHPNGNQNSPRSYADRIGMIRNVRIEPGDGGLRGDFHANPKHRLWEQLKWDAEHAPESVGFSHSVIAKTSNRQGKVFVEEITRVTSVDLVADPATTRGLFEGDDKGLNMPDTLTEASLREQYPGLVQVIEQKAGKQALDKHATSEEAKQLQEDLKTLREENDKFKAAEALNEKRRRVDVAIEEAKMPKELVTDVFREQLASADDDQMKALIADRMGLAKSTGPRSKEQAVSEGSIPTTTSDLKVRWTA